MALNSKLIERCNSLCELCNTNAAEIEFNVILNNNDSIENKVALCETCFANFEDASKADYWRCLEGSIWNPEPSVQALSYRLLYILKENNWANDVLGSIDLDENVVQMAISAFEVVPFHCDAYTNKLENGDTIVLTQALNVKGTSFTVAKGTIIKKIRLVADNVEQIEGKINDQTIVILTKFVKKGG